MKILGINGWIERGHDGGAALLEDGKLKFAIEEERLIGIRHAYDRIPYESIRMICEKEKISIEDINIIAIGWDYPNLWKMFGAKFISKKEMSKVILGTEKYADKIMYVEHHIAHACSAFYPSGFEKALVLVIDGQGEYIATSVFLGDKKKNKLTKLYETSISLGYFYAAVTEHIGFFSGQEGKTMGLASYGKPVYAKQLRKLISAEDNGVIKCAFSVAKKGKDEEEETIAIWRNLLEDIIPSREGKIEEITSDIIPYANLAASAQKVLEEILIKIVEYNCKKYNVQNVAIAGGVGLNCAASGILSELTCVDKIFTQPAANDGGISLGAAIAAATQKNEKVDFEMIPYQGNEFNEEEVLQFLRDGNYNYHKAENFPKEIAQLISEGKIVAVFQGRLEFGPRALGNRSILADPRSAEMLLKLNTLKGREVWRPLAPAILFEHQTEYFSSNQFSPYMTINSRVIEEVRNNLGAVTHVDGTARIQSVSKRYNPSFHLIIEEFYKITGVPVVINTSFNVKGEPIVATTKEAMDSAMAMNLDYLAMENYIIKLHNN